MTPTPDDVERVINNYVDPSSTSSSEAESDLEEAGFTDAGIDAFSDDILGSEEVSEAVESRDSPGVTTREQIESLAEDSAPEGTPSDRIERVAQDTAREAGAPSESALDSARAQAAQNVEGSKLRSNPDLDPLSDGDQGREILDLSEASLGGGKRLGDGNDLSEGVERTGRNSGTFYLEDSSGERYPVSEVDL